MPNDLMSALIPIDEIIRRFGMNEGPGIGRAALFPGCIAGTPGVAVLAWLACFVPGPMLEIAGLLHAASMRISASAIKRSMSRSGRIRYQPLYCLPAPRFVITR